MTTEISMPESAPRDALQLPAGDGFAPGVRVVVEEALVLGDRGGGIALRQAHLPEIRVGNLAPGIDADDLVQLARGLVEAAGLVERPAEVVAVGGVVRRELRRAPQAIHGARD